MLEFAVDSPVDVLLVDDDERNLLALAALLACPDYRIAKARGAAEMLAHLAEKDVAVVLLDVMMPEADGFECARLIKQRPSSSTTPIIFVTALALDPSFVARGYEVGAADYITKPLEPEVVRAKVAVFAQLFRATRLLTQQIEVLRTLCSVLEAEASRHRQGEESVTHELRSFVHRCEQQLAAVSKRQASFSPSDLDEINAMVGEMMETLLLP